MPTRTPKTIITLLLTHWLGGMITLLPMAAQATTNKVMVLTSLTHREQTTATGYQGLLASVGQVYQEGVTSYPLNKGYSLELFTYVDQNPLASLSQEEDTVAIICQTTSDCQPAVTKAAAKELLVIAVLAHDSELPELNEAGNIIRMYPSDKLQTLAMYQHLKKSHQTPRFAVVYEPSLVSMNLHNEVIANYYTDLEFDHADRPKWVGSFPVSDYLSLAPSQRGTTAATLLQILPTLNLEAILFAGSRDSFEALTGGASNPLRALQWYTRDTILPLTTGFAGLQIFSVYRPDEEVSQEDEYYFAYDAGTFLNQVIENYIPEEGRIKPADFLKVAKETVLVSTVAKTGTKTFASADSTGLFRIQRYDEKGQPAGLEVIEVKTN